MTSHTCVLCGPLPELETTTFLPVVFQQDTPAPPPERGDLVQVMVYTPGEPIKTYHRQVVSTEVPEYLELVGEFLDQPPCMTALLAPLDLPLMRQVEVTGGDGSTQVIWVASETPPEPGDLIRDEKGGGNLHVSRVFTSLDIMDVPVGALISSALLRSPTSELIS